MNVRTYSPRQSRAIVCANCPSVVSCSCGVCVCVYETTLLLSTGSRINTINDFGHVSLDIRGLRDSDNGVYECRAVNSLGEAVTTASVTVQTKGSLILDSQHPAGMQKITALESGKGRRPLPDQSEASFGKPVFTSPLQGTAEVGEGKAAHMECRVVPVGDPAMTFEWAKNGEPLNTGSRIQASHDFGFVSLDILKCVAEDAGMYTVTARNLAGESSSSFALHVGAHGVILGDTMHPESYKKIAALEAAKDRPKERPLVEAGPNQPPVFMVPLEDVGLVAEGTKIHVEARVEPKNDPQLRIEWELNGKVISTGRERGGGLGKGISA
jgi:titin